MAISATHRGWWWDVDNTRLRIYVNGTLVGYFDNASPYLVVASGLTVTAGGATIAAGGLTVSAGGLTVTADGLTVTAGVLSVDDTTDSTSGITGSIHTDGGLGVAKQTYHGDHVTMADAKNIVVNATTGTKIGTAITQKLGFYGVTPVAQPGAYTQTYATADKTNAAIGATAIAAVIPAAAPAGGTGTAAGGWDTAANRDAAITTINDLRSWIVEVDADYEALLVDVTDAKQLLNSIIDDLQALGLAA